MFLRVAWSTLFGLERPIDRGLYIGVGLSLMALKLSVDMALLFGLTGRIWWPWSYLSFLRLVDQVPDWALWTLMLWAVPFAWIGLSMSVRRALDAGLSPWLGLVFCLPIVNLGLMLSLSLLPSRPPPQTSETRRRGSDPLTVSGGGIAGGKTPGKPAGLAGAQADDPRTRPWLYPIAAAVSVALAMTLVGVILLESLGLVLFAATPFGMGVVASYLFNHGSERTLGASISTSFASLVVAAGLLLLFAIEGAYCLLMAFPLAVPMALAGTWLGRGIARQPRLTASPLMMVLLLLILSAWAEPHLESRAPSNLRQVTSSVVINAPPEVVWRNVVELTPLPPPTELWFRFGIAYPTHARLEGSGVGAVRYCEFSTGSFVEPIRVWNPPFHLAFGVIEQPAPLRELSPYPVVHADHREHSLRSRRGEFRLYRLESGATRLEGSTWYELYLLPRVYWALWTDPLIASIHRRVLEHIRSESET